MKCIVRCAATLLAFGFAAHAHAVPIYGLTSTNALVKFDSSAPGTIISSVALSGLNGGASLIGIDFRPATAGLYGLSTDNRLYVIDVATGVATSVGPAGAFALSGTSYGIDFNPTVDRIRVVSDADQNLRLNPITGTLAATDANLVYAAGDANAGANPNIVDAAYTNSFAGATTTTLYDIDSNLDILVVQNPPNNGVLNTVGALGVNASSNVGFDIAAFTNQAFASIQLVDSPFAGFYSIDLATGAAAFIGAIGSRILVTDIAIAAVPEPETVALLIVGLVAIGLRARRRRVAA